MDTALITSAGIFIAIYIIVIALSKNKLLGMGIDILIFLLCLFLSQADFILPTDFRRILNGGVVGLIVSVVASLGWIWLQGRTKGV